MSSIIRQIIEKGNLVEIAKEYGIILKNTGTNFKARCPFHQERTPSFFINPVKNLYHCFGCNKAGNIIIFVSEIEKISMNEAIKKLTHKLHIKLEYGFYKSQKDDKVSNVMRELAIYMNELLKKEEFKNAYNYLLKRGINKESIEQYCIGYAPIDYKIYDKFAREKNILVDLGIFGRDGNIIYPILRDRIVFPIFDAFGRIVAFGGRIIEDKDNVPKYLNTKENKWFEKKSLFYAHPNYTNDLAYKQSAIIVEGYFDQILMNQFGFSNTLGILGSAFTTSHSTFLEKYVKKVYFLYDEDDAGHKSALSTLDTVINGDFESYYVTSNTGLDPSDIILKFGREKIVDCLKNAKTLIDFYFEYIKNKMENTNDTNEKAKYIDAVLQKIMLISHPIKRELLLSHLANYLGLNLKNLEENFNHMLKTQKKGFNIYYSLSDKNYENRALYELESELLYIISKDTNLREKSQQLGIKNYIITPFYQRLYDAIMADTENCSNITILMEDDAEYMKFIPYLCKFEYMNEYEITTQKLLNVIENLKNYYIKNQIENTTANELEKAIELKKQILEI